MKEYERCDMLEVNGTKWSYMGLLNIIETETELTKQANRQKHKQEVTQKKACGVIMSLGQETVCNRPFFVLDADGCSSPVA